ncbi:MAG: hypothetical protein AAFU85_31265, partial [Planctomycetota bacterium]
LPATKRGLASVSWAKQIDTLKRNSAGTGNITSLTRAKAFFATPVAHGLSFARFIAEANSSTARPVMANDRRQQGRRFGSQFVNATCRPPLHDMGTPRMGVIGIGGSPTD